jgi:hypothetical protein
MAVWGFPRREKGLTPLLDVEPNLPPIKNPERGPAIDLADAPQKVTVSVNTFIPDPISGPTCTRSSRPATKYRQKRCRSCETGLEERVSRGCIAHRLQRVDTTRCSRPAVSNDGRLVFSLRAGRHPFSPYAAASVVNARIEQTPRARRRGQP